MSEPKPVAPADNVTADWWDATRQARLLVQRCSDCRHAQMYPRSSCTECGSAALGWSYASGRGVVWSHTTVHRAPHPAFEPPYVVALVRLEEGPILMANIIGYAPDEVRCDQPVDLVWEDLPDGRKLPQWQPASPGD